MPIESVGFALDTKGTDEPVVHEPSELVDGLIGSRWRPSVDHQRVAEHRDRDLPDGHQARRRRGHARQRCLNGWMGGRVEGHRTRGRPAGAGELREHQGLLSRHRSRGRRRGHRNVDYTGRPPWVSSTLSRKSVTGRRFRSEDIEEFIRGVSDATIPDYQVSALLMAIVLRGMSDQETAWLTDAMVRSGDRVDLSSVPGTKVGKHSTGGVGDKVSIALSPIAAACGVVVPKMSGRGLGHTGGTLDKLEAIPGFRVNLSIQEFTRMLVEVGATIVGQTSVARTRRQDALRAERRDRDGAEHSAHRGIGDEQEARGEQSGAGPRRQVRPRRLHEVGGRRARAGTAHGCHRDARGYSNRGVHHRHGCTTWAVGWQRRRNHRVHRDPEGSWARRYRRPGRDAGVATARAVRPLHGRRRGARCSTGAGVGRGVGEAASHGRLAGR